MQAYRLSGCAKVDGAVEYILSLLENDVKLLIFAHHKTILDRIEEALMKKKIKSIRIDGDVMMSDRQNRVDQFQNKSDIMAALLSISAAGVGLTLTASSTVVFAEMHWTPAMMLQAEDRAHRIGQKREVRVYRLITTTKIEEDILTKATMKKDLDAKIIQAGMFNDKASDLERQKKLEDLIRKDYEDDDPELDSEIPNDDQINEIIARNPEEYDIFTEMDQKRYKDEKMDERVRMI